MHVILISKLEASLIKNEMIITLNKAINKFLMKENQESLL